MGKETLFRWQNIVREKLQGALMIPKREYGENCTQRACTYTKCNISDLAVYLRSYNFASGLVASVGCIVRPISYSLMKLNSITAVTIAHTFLMCLQIRILTPLRKGNFNYISESLCGVKFWMIR
jgi:hypothetical protein